MQETTRLLAENTSPILLKGRFQLPETRLWGGRVLLYKNCVVFQGRRFFKRYRRTIQLEEVESISWWTGGQDANLVFFLKGTDAFACQIRGAGRWKFEIDQLLADKGRRKVVLPDASLVCLNEDWEADSGDGQGGLRPPLGNPSLPNGKPVTRLDSHLDRITGPLFVPREKLAALVRLEWKEEGGRITCRLFMKSGEVFEMDVKGHAVISISERNGAGYHINNILRLIPSQKVSRTGR